MADFKIKLVAETAEAQKAIENFVKQTKGIRLNSKPFEQLADSSGKANIALMNFGRVLSDAPYGLIGVANNIDPLIQSFQSLGTATKSTGGPMKALVAALKGPAGVAIAITAVTSLLVKYGDEIFNAIADVSAFTKSLIEAGTEGAKAFYTSRQEFSKLSRAINDQNSSFVAQKNALDDVNGKLREYGIRINSVTEFQRIGTEVGRLYAEMKKYEARGNVLAGMAANEFAKQTALAFKVQQGDVFGAFDELSFLKKAQTILAFAYGAESAGFAAFNKNLKETGEESAKTTRLLQKQADINYARADGIVKQIKAIGGVTEDYGDKTKDTDSKIKAFFNSLQKVVEKGRELDNTPTLRLRDIALAAVAAREELQKMFNRGDITKGQLATGLNAITTNISNLTEKLKDATITWQRLNEVAANTALGQAFEQYDKAEKKRNDQAFVKSYREGIVAPNDLSRAAQISPILQRAANAYDNLTDAQKFSVEKTKAWQESLVALGKVISEFTADSLIEVGNSIGDALTGGFKGFDSFIALFADALSSIGKILIQYGVLATGIQAAIEASLITPAGAAAMIVGGIALVALSKALKNKVGEGMRLFTGGIVTQPTRALIGEGGAEAVIPLNQFASLLAGRASGGTVVEVRGRLRGSDIYLSGMRGQTSNGRLYG